MTEEKQPFNVPVKVKKLGTISRFDKFVDVSEHIDIQNISVAQLYDLLKKTDFPKLVENLRKSQYDLDKHLADYKNPHKVTIDQLVKNPVEWIYETVIPGKASYSLNPNFSLRANVVSQSINTSFAYDQLHISTFSSDPSTQLLSDYDVYVKNEKTPTLDYEQVETINVLNHPSMVKDVAPATVPNWNTSLNSQNANNCPFLQNNGAITCYNASVSGMVPCVMIDTGSMVKGSLSFFVKTQIAGGNLGDRIKLVMYTDNKEYAVVDIADTYSDDLTNSIQHYTVDGSDITHIGYSIPLSRPWYKVVFQFTKPTSKIYILATNASTDKIKETWQNPTDDALRKMGSLLYTTMSFVEMKLSDDELGDFGYIDTSLMSDKKDTLAFDLSRYNSTDNLVDVSTFNTLTYRSVNIPSLVRNVKTSCNFGDISFTIENRWVPKNSNASIGIKTVYSFNIANFNKFSGDLVYEATNSQVATSLTLTLQEDKTIAVKQNGDLSKTILSGTYANDKFKIPADFSLSDRTRLHSIETFQHRVDDDEMDYLNSYFSTPF